MGEASSQSIKNDEIKFLRIIAFKFSQLHPRKLQGEFIHEMAEIWQGFTVAVGINLMFKEENEGRKKTGAKILQFH